MNAYRGKGPWQEKVSKGEGGEKGEKGWGKKGGSKGNGKGDKDKRKGFPRQLSLVRRVGSFPKSLSPQGRVHERDSAHEGSAKEWVPGEQHGGRQAAGPTRPGDTGELQLENTHWWKMTRKRRKHVSRRN